MATVSDITTIPLSGLLHIDALLDTGPDWNYLTGNTIYYTFSIASGNEDPKSAQKNFTGPRQAFNAAQQAAVKALLADGGELNTLTGIHFVETTDGNAAQIHLCNVDLIDNSVTGLCSWQSSYQYELGTNKLVSYDADAYVYLDNVQFPGNANLAKGSSGYETLLHEMGHALGLKHSFYQPTDDNPNPIYLPFAQDNTGNTLMSYRQLDNKVYSEYSPYDVAALNWLYGRDGLGGALGINSTTGGRYFTGTNGADTLIGTAADDKLEGDGGNDMIDGGNGFDTAVFRGARSNYTLTSLANGDLTVTSLNGIDGVDTLRSVEVLQFADMSVSRAAVVDTTAPDKPTMVVTKNANGYATGSTPLITGKAEGGATINILTAGTLNTGGGQVLGTAQADANGLYTLKLNPLPNGNNYQVYATATDAAGNVSVASDIVSFKVDATAPVTPTYIPPTLSASGNQATFTGTGEANSTIELVRAGDLQTIARTTVDGNGKWEITTSPLPNDTYTISVISIDQADNGASAANRTTLTINSAANIAGTAGNDTLRPGAGNNAVDGGAGTDTVVYAGTRNNYTLGQEAWGYGITDKAGTNGHDSLINVERVHFEGDNSWVALDVDGYAGQLYRLYSAAFGRPSDDVGMGFWIWRMETGSSLNTVAREFMAGQPEYDKMYGINPSDETLVTLLYKNVLHRDPDSEGFQYWLNALAHNSNPNKDEVRAQVLIEFAESLENQVNVIDKFKLGIDYISWVHA